MADTGIKFYERRFFFYFYKMRSFITTFIFCIIVGIIYRWIADPPLTWAKIPPVITVALVLSLVFTLAFRPRKK
ncbi:hypothetical protein BW716_13855 [[Flexibacter] sp. ATCC 35208]|nr:hypothetical protein BW716_13855 [[Flexibacter] sp. ATCC 35208]